MICTCIQCHAYDVHNLFLQWSAFRPNDIPYPFFVGFSIRGVVVETRLILTHIITIIMTSRSQILEPKA